MTVFLFQRLTKLEEIKNEQNVRINTSLNILKEIQNPYTTESTLQQPQQPISQQECITVPQLELQTEIVSGEGKKRFSEGLEDLAEQSLISDSSRDTEVDTEQLQPLKGVKIYICTYYNIYMIYMINFLLLNRYFALSVFLLTRV